MSKQKTENKEKYAEAEKGNIIEYLKSIMVKIEDLKKIEKHIRIKLVDEHYKEYEDLVKNINLVYEVFKYSKNVTGIINLLEAIYKFEAIFHSDITTLIIKMANGKYYANIHVYVPISMSTFDIIKSELLKLCEKIRKKEKREVLDFSSSGLEADSFVKNDRIAGKLLLPLYVSNRKLGMLIFYYLDYRRVRARD